MGKRLNGIDLSRYQKANLFKSKHCGQGVGGDALSAQRHPDCVRPRQHGGGGGSACRCSTIALLNTHGACCAHNSVADVTQSHCKPNPALSRAGAIARAVENVFRDPVRRMDSRILGGLGTGSVAKDIPERCLHLRCRGHPKAVPVIPRWPAKLTKLAVDNPNAPGLAPALVLIVPIMPATRKNKGLASCGALLYSPALRPAAQTDCSGCG